MQIQSDAGAGRLLRPVQAVNPPVGSQDSADNDAVDLGSVGDKFYRNDGMQISGIWR
ncbi:hypothetical protein HXZ95_03510 [Acinetobacter pseudolwoffii]|nr:hypothetical protein [Acinetobacter pseudolwoffii]